VIGVSLGTIGTASARQHLRNVLAYLDVPTAGQPEAFIQNKEDLFDDKEHVGNQGTQKFPQIWVDTYVARVKTHNG